MSFAALMVHLEIEPHVPRRVDIAVDLAERFQAALIGVAGWAPHPAFAAEGVVIDAEYTAREFEDMRARLAETEAAFRQAAKPLRNAEWRGSLEMPIDLVLREARAADLLVLGRARRSADWYSSLDVGGTLLRAGRPVLVVPPDIDRLSARRIVVAWKDTRECRRAVADAMPFLTAADQVLLLQACERTPEAERRLDDVTAYLVRHRVAVGAKTCLPAKKGTVAAKLLSFAADEKADLLVAGGYGHSRLGEWIFGGVTKEVIEKSPICCLLSH